MTDLKQLAQNLRNYNAWRRGDGKNANIEMPHPIDLGTWIDSAIAVVEAHAKSNVLAQRAEKLEADRDALAGISKELIERLREAAAQRVASTAMIGADDLIAAADALEIATAGMNAYCDELGSCLKAAGFGSADDPMAQEGVGAFSDPLCVAAFVESQFKRIVAERDALAAELKALREQEPVSPDLLESARAVVARWDAPTWKDFPATAEYIGRLRAAIAQADLDGALTAEEWVVKNVSGSPGLVRAMVIRAEVAESAIETPAKISPCAGHAVQRPDPLGVLSCTHPDCGRYEGHRSHECRAMADNACARPSICQGHAAQQESDDLVGLRGCNSRHGGIRSGYPCIYRMRTTDPGCTGCADRDEDQPTKAGDSILGEQK